MKFSWNKTDKPIVCLAPMAGFTDSAFRQIVKSITPEVICFSELTSINAIQHNSEKTIKMLEFSEKEQPLIMQFFGNDIEAFIKAAQKLESLGSSAGIDINMGCPAPKITKNCYGSALLEHPETAAKIVENLSKATSLPISVKMRIGYKSYDEEKFKKTVKLLEKAGAKAITIHGRTTKQGYSGKANFEPIYLAKEIVKIPVIGNGDITTVEEAINKLTSPDGKTTLDGLMIGRATIGNPWILKDIYNALHKIKQTTSKSNSVGTSGGTSGETSTNTSGRTSTNTSLSFAKKLPTIKKHFKLALKFHGEKVGLLEMRKHLGSYLSGIPNASTYRSEIFREDNPEKVIEMLEKIGKI